MRGIILALMLTGCASTEFIPPVEAPTFHPEFPAPYSVCNIVWEVLEVQGNAKVALSYNDNITAAICDQDKDRYIQQLLNLTCYYRQDISERICSPQGIQ